ncbi:hypothetical protein [Nioella aestuarii]|uniref:hypothetical protein n=1 Tax=Nioella aestuarii TaxID=1662864 RepID=UPI003D7F53DF
MITTAPLDQIAYGALDIDILGFELDDGCLSAREREDLAEIGITELVLDRGQMRLEYDYASSGLTLDILADTAGMAELRAHVDFSYFAVNFETEEPVADLAYAEIEVTDQGYWPVIAAEIPPMMLVPDVIVAALVDELLPRYVDPAQAPAPAPEAPSDGKGDEEGQSPAPAVQNSPERTRPPMPLSRPAPQPSPGLPPIPAACGWSLRPKRPCGWMKICSRISGLSSPRCRPCCSPMRTGPTAGSALPMPQCCKIGWRAARLSLGTRICCAMPRPS